MRFVRNMLNSYLCLHLSLVRRIHLRSLLFWFGRTDTLLQQCEKLWSSNGFSFTDTQTNLFSDVVIIRSSVKGSSTY